MDGLKLQKETGEPALEKAFEEGQSDVEKHNEKFATRKTFAVLRAVTFFLNQ